VDDNALNEATLRAALNRAVERRDRAAGEFEAAAREVEWLRQGLKLHGPNADSDGDDMLHGVLPDGVPEQPTLRQAIVLVMRASPSTPWTTEEIVKHLWMNGWSPQGEPTKRVTDMAHLMVKEGHLNRVGRGSYQLSKLMAGAIERALPRITDYRLAGELGLPVPDHPAASKGLRE
jgi:hypothetical protein